jgi:hypothetical protein
LPSAWRWAALSGAAGARPSPEHAFILESLTEPLVRDGYVFHYTRTTGTRYQITASPVEFGKSGGKNSFIDESAIIRVTSEDRPATQRDDPLQQRKDQQITF